jgi:[ribosomal protein S5]-alanine N-acetyltransferase
MKIEDIYNDLPTLETERLKLRKFTLDNAQDVFNYASEPDVSRFVPWEAHQSIEDSYNFINYILKQYEEAKLAPWAIEFKQNKKVIGTIDFVAWFPRHFRAEMGFILSKEYWGMGLMVEATTKVIQFGFEKMELKSNNISCVNFCTIFIIVTRVSHKFDFVKKSHGSIQIVRIA